MATAQPYSYNAINGYNSLFQPSTMHAQATNISRFYQRYLLNRAMARFDFTLPETWCRDYTLYTVFMLGYTCVFNTDKFGIINQYGGLSGFNVFYEPTTVHIANPIIGSKTAQIGQNCELIRLQPTYCGIYDIVSYYADLLALCAEGIAVNLVNSKVSTVFYAKNKAAAETYKKMFDRVASGEPAVAVGDSVFDDMGKPLWQNFQNDVKSSFIVPEILDSMRNIELMFDEAIGIPSANKYKKERMVVDEVTAGTATSFANCATWLDYLTESIAKVVKMFPQLAGKLSVKLREPQQDEQKGVI